VLYRGNKGGREGVSERARWEETEEASGVHGGEEGRKEGEQGRRGG